MVPVGEHPLHIDVLADPGWAAVLAGISLCPSIVVLFVGQEAVDKEEK